MSPSRALPAAHHRQMTLPKIPRLCQPPQISTCPVKYLTGSTLSQIKRKLFSLATQALHNSLLRPRRPHWPSTLRMGPKLTRPTITPTSALVPGPCTHPILSAWARSPRVHTQPPPRLPAGEPAGMGRRVALLKAFPSPLPPCCTSFSGCASPPLPD